MPQLSGWLRSRLLRLDPHEATFARRGFPPADPFVRHRLEAAARAFITGYNAALDAKTMTGLHQVLGRAERPLAGFAYEGAAMALVLLDTLSVRSWRFTAFIQGAGAPHVYLAFVGAGWACARLPSAVRPDPRRTDGLLGWLAFDGWGFHDGFFHWRRHAAGAPSPNGLSGYAPRAFDQGLGRSMWFVHGARVDDVAHAIAACDPGRRPDLWSGVGLAATYAGGAGEATLRQFCVHAGDALPHVRQGAAFAVAARLRGGNLTDGSAEACVALCGVEAAEAARIVNLAARDLPASGREPAYEVWRARIRQALSAGFDLDALRKVG